MSHGLHPALERANLAGRNVDASDRGRFLAIYGPLFDHAPWVVERAWDKRPFADAKALHCAFLRIIAEATAEERLALARSHPERADHESLQALGRAYNDKHGFPFIICVKLNDRASILAAIRLRLERDSEAELDEAMTQVGLISRLRLADIKV
ncbi:MAG: 2-oxo-4-hydroxy-4-carboxy-5-ureidoimidazoline decarboxylase [Caulobacteraceae bacterium]